ncbi:MAG TPA: Calx-beta domain-containing protein [Solirubrobacteraceae bacterium]|nr:Calx-beta domain-containing protein [Solirubrobacteraceae bacterium]
MPLLRPAALLGAALAVALAPAAGAAKPARPDLAVTSASTKFLSWSPGSSLLITHVTKNRGRRTAAASRTNFVLSADRRRDPSDTLLPIGSPTRRLAAGRTAVVTTQTWIPLTVKPGRYHLLVCADADGQVREAREGDNCRVLGLGTVDAPPKGPPGLPPVITPAPIAPVPEPQPEPLPLYDDMVPFFTVSPVTVAEGETARVVVRISSPRERTPFELAWSTVDGTAAAPADFAAASGTLRFEPGVSERVVEIPTVADADDEADETFTVVLDPQWHRPRPGDGVVTITD